LCLLRLLDATAPRPDIQLTPSAFGLLGSHSRVPA
jgi:hypothetical protein